MSESSTGSSVNHFSALSDVSFAIVVNWPWWKHLYHQNRQTLQITIFLLFFKDRFLEPTPKFLNQQILNGSRKFAFFTVSQVMLLLVTWDQTLRTINPTHFFHNQTVVAGLGERMSQKWSACLIALSRMHDINLTSNWSCWPRSLS